MNKKLRFSFITATVLMIFVLSAVWTAPAFADDEMPPPTETPVTETEPTQPAAEAVGESTVESVPAEEAAPAAGLLEQLPEGTTVVVTNSDGKSLPLASEEAAQIVASGDPMWCPSGVTPGGAGCTTPGQTSFATMLAELSLQNSGTGPNKAGVIWIEDDYDSGVNEPAETNFTLDGAVLTSMAKYALIIQGGWTGIGKTINQFDPSEFNASLSILDWKAPITLNDILISGATVNPNFGTSGTSALIVKSTSSITLNRVHIKDSGNNLNGADLTNEASTSLSPIVVNDSVFNHNNADGLRVLSHGVITIRNLIANYNGLDNGNNLEYGAFITNFTGSNNNKSIALNGTNEFKGNLGIGLYVTSYGAVTLNNITAFANDDITDGDDGDGSGVIVGTSASIKMTGTNLINYNQLNGLELNSFGAISLNNVTASNNGASGVRVDTSSSINMTGTNLINYNQANGLRLNSTGAISLNNVTASNNGANGAYVNNCLKPLSNTPCTTTAKSVTLTGSNAFNWNGTYGLYVEASGAITISQISASHNVVGAGALLDNCASSSPSATICTTPLPYAVSITSPATFLSNGFDGLRIITTGAVTLKGITASFNHNLGVSIDNRASLLKPQNVTLSGVNTINGNDNIGLRVLSYGAVSLASITANDNGRTDSAGYGVFVDNRALSVSPAGSILITRKPVTFTGNNTLNNNYSGGIFIYSVGDVTLSNVTAVGNGVPGTGDGVYIENLEAWYPNGVTQTNYAANVTLNGFSFFEDNGDEGLQIFSRGAVKLNNVTASENGDVGLSVNNAYIPTMSTRQPVTLAGTNSFNNNDGGGVMIYSYGAVTLSNITANGNLDTSVTNHGAGDGVFIQNNLSWSPNSILTSYVANVTISGFGYFENNIEDGLDIQSKGAVTLVNTTANSNGDDGVAIFTVGNLLPQNVTLNGVNNFYGNGFTSTNGHGLFIQSDGKITINSLNAIGNRGDGALLDNWTYLKTGKFLGVTLTGFNAFQENQGADGLYIHSDGIVTLSRITADKNSGNGVHVITIKNITLSCGTAFSNTGTGFLLDSDAILTLKGLHAYYNGTDENLVPGYTSLIRTWSCP